MSFRVSTLKCSSFNPINFTINFTILNIQTIWISLTSMQLEVISSSFQLFLSFTTLAKLCLPPMQLFRQISYKNGKSCFDGLRVWFPSNLILIYENAEAVTRRCSAKKVFLQISQNSLENTCVRASFLIKVQAWGLQLY